MKNYLIIAVAITLLSACNRQELADSKSMNDSLASLVSEREQALNDFIVSFNEIESNLDSVAVKQHIITMSVDNPGELKKSRKARINDEIIAIN
ncbi:MAG: hypothetical protein NTV09_13255, partial [Bacteroidetes bacterium]|nr:hypothetical protein [Bacteroidota bacterium]